MKNTFKRISVRLITVTMILTMAVMSFCLSASAVSAASQLKYGGGACGRYIIMDANYPCEGELIIPSHLNGIPVTEIYFNALSYTNITSLYMPDTITNLYGGSNFEGCRKLKEARISDNLKVIPRNTFNQCEALEKLYIGKSVTLIDVYAFQGCKKLEYIELPYSIQDIRRDAFYDAGLKCIFYPGSASDWAKVNVSEWTVERTILYVTEITEVSVNSDGVKVSADARPGAATYIFYRQEKLNGSWSVWKEVGTSSTEYFTDKTALTGHTYRYAVKAANGPYTTDMSSASKEITVVKKTDILKECTVTLSKTAYTYSGKEITPTVTVKGSNGKVLIKDTDYTVQYENGRKSTGRYTVTVTGKGNYEGKKELTFTIAPKTTSKITATQTTTSITLSWNKVAGADGYRVYVYNTSTKKYEKLKDVKNPALKVTGLKAGTAYKYKIKAYKKDDGAIYGAASDAFETCTKPATPTLKVTSTKTGVASLSWNNVAGESGYQIYYSTKKDSGYKKLATYKANTVKGTKSNLKSKSTYYFKVRAYKVTESGTVYSSWSSVKQIKIK